MTEHRVAAITGASSGVGAASAKALAAAGFHVVLGARRLDRLQAIAEPLGGEARRLDVTDEASVADFTAGLPRLDLLVNNAGAALGLDTIDNSSEERWRAMWELNFLGVARVTQALLPALRHEENNRGGHILNIGSTSGFEVYPGGAGYTGSKHALRALTRTLRLELVGEPVRVTEISPGLIETEFSLVRFDQDHDKASSVYSGMNPLTADDVAACVVFAATQPPHVNIDEIVVRPLDQAHSTLVHRRTR